MGIWELNQIQQPSYWSVSDELPASASTGLNSSQGFFFISLNYSVQNSLWFLKQCYWISNERHEDYPGVHYRGHSSLT